MNKKLLSFVIAVFAVPVLLLAQSSGKIAGKVTDKATGEGLPLANVILEGTGLGAATDENGNYTILNVPPGTYTIKARYLGYTDATTQGINVNSGLTRTVNLALNSDALQIGEVVVTAERPLINPNVTNTTAIKTADDIQNLPVRGVNNIVALQGGVVNVGGTLYIRGGRADETQFNIEGVNVTGAMTGGSRLSLIDNAVEEIQVQTGGQGAEFGGANGGVVSSSMRAGGSNLKFGLEYITDGFGVDAENSAFGLLNGFTRGYNEFVVSASGPIPGISGLTFFAAGRYQSREAAGSFRDGVKVSDIPVKLSIFNNTPGTTGVNAYQTIDTLISVNYPKYLLDSERSQIDLNGSINFNLSPFAVKYSALFTLVQADNGSGVVNVFNRGNTGESFSQTQLHSLKLTHTIDPTFFYTVTGSWFNDYQVNYDKKFKHSVASYGDPDKNPQYVYNTGGNQIFSKYGSFNYADFGWNYPGTVTATYLKYNQHTFSFKGDFVKQFGRVHELKGGFDFTTSVIRNIGYNPATLKQRLITNSGLSETAQRIKIARDISANAYGYDIYGDEVDDELVGPKKPTTFGLHVTDKMEYQDLVLSLGLRYDYISTKAWSITRVNGLPAFTESNDGYGYVNPANIKEQEAFSYLQPRVGLSLPVTDKTTFHANYGKYVQSTRLRDVYLGWAFTSRILLAGGNAFSDPVGFDIEPTRTTSYELGFKQQITDNAAFNVTAFYNNKEGQIQLRTVSALRAGQPSSFYAYQNGDFATSQGVQLGLILRRTNRVQANVNYTYSDARGTGSTSSGQFRSVWLTGTQPFLPNYQNPLSFNQTHTGSVEVDYRFGKNDGPEVGGLKLFEEFGVSILYTFNSGTPYTRYEGYTSTASRPLEAVNTSTTPWVSEVDLRVDKSFQIEGISMNAYVRINNLLNSRNVLGVFGQTGDAYNDGYLQTVEGSGRAAVLGPKYNELYEAMNNQNNPGFFNAPRMFVLGLKLDF